VVGPTKKTQRWFFKQRAEILIYSGDPLSWKEREPLIPSFSPLSKLMGPTKRNVHGSLLAIGSTSAVLMEETSDLAHLLMDRIEDFQHYSQYSQAAQRSQGHGVTSKHDMSVQITRPIFALGTLVCSFDRIFRGEFRTSNLS